MKRNDYVIGNGDNRYEFPIVRGGSVKPFVSKLYVNEESFEVALVLAIKWAREYSQNQRDKSNDETLEFWPLVYRRLTAIRPRVRMYARKADLPYIYVESKDYSEWVHIRLLEAI